MKILALEPYYGGSHQAFIDGWSAISKHQWTKLTLPPYKWKWRMRHAAITMANDVHKLTNSGQMWDILFCSDMLNLAEFLGLAPAAIQTLPSIAYFHENQLTYPVRHETERDYHFALTNITTALAADRIWFNSAFHRDSFLNALPGFLNKMPDYQPIDAVEIIRNKSSIQPQGIDEFPDREPRKPGPMRILWAARWEHDKNPETFFQTLQILKSKGIDFRISVIGEQFRQSPQVFDTAKQQFQEHIDRWGYQKSRKDYIDALIEADIIVSTANHEFFGISAVEAIAAGAYPLLPRRLAYPEILSTDNQSETEEFFYRGKANELAQRLTQLSQRIENNNLWQSDPHRAKKIVARFKWKNLAPVLDNAINPPPTQ
ncbi:MAG: tRNA-queuosine alpha-mannosyltransferase domain-containing protein [Planctomycetota bacterium]|jgi:glycosyltransferase involved in cell wall biosynthesis